MQHTDPYTKEGQTRYTLRIDSELLEKIRVDAMKHKRSTVKQIEFILEQYISAQPGE